MQIKRKPAGRALLATKSKMLTLYRRELRQLAQEAWWAAHLAQQREPDAQPPPLNDAEADHIIDRLFTY